MLLVLDGATEPASLRDLVPAAGSCAVLITSLGLAEWGEHDTYRLPPLIRLFSAELGAEVPRLSGTCPLPRADSSAVRLRVAIRGLPAGSTF